MSRSWPKPGPPGKQSDPAVVSKTAGSRVSVLAALSNGNAAARPQFAASPRFIGNPEVAEIGTTKRRWGYSWRRQF